MNGDLFSSETELERIPIRDAEIYYQPHLIPGSSADSIFRKLIAEVPWRAEKIVVWGKTFDQPRLIAWFGEDGHDYTYSGIHLNPLPWTPILLDLKRHVELVAQTGFNSVLLNYYRNNHDSMGFHSDDERELGDQPIIASLSLGETRTLILKHKTEKALKPVRLKLTSGSLLLMKGDTQKYWKHGIDKETRPCMPRVNLTFRHIKNFHEIR